MGIWPGDWGFGIGMADWVEREGDMGKEGEPVKEGDDPRGRLYGSKRSSVCAKLGSAE
jgi:hypothetical protein